MKSIRDFYVGQTVQIDKIITSDMIDEFASFSGDDNQLHLDKDFASKTEMKNIVVHGMINLSFVSQIIGTHLPGHGALWVSNSNNFLKPCRVNDKINFIALIKSIDLRSRIISVEVFARNQFNELILESKCEVYWPDTNETLTRNHEFGRLLILGGNGGIGKALLKYLLTSTEHNIITTVRNKKDFKNSFEAIKWSDRLEIIEWSLEKEEDFESLLDILKTKENAEVSGYVNCFSNGLVKKDILDVTTDEVTDVLTSCVLQNYSMIKKLIHSKLMQKGSIVFIGSTASTDAESDWPMYSLAKSFQTALSYKLAKRLGSKKIRVNEVSPGVTSTDLTQNVSPRGLAIQKNKTFLKKLANPEEIAAVIGFLLSEDSSHISGQNITVDGGQ